MKKCKKDKKICFISSTGGHYEQLIQLQMVQEKYEHFYVLPNSVSFKNLNERRYLLPPVSRKDRITGIVTYSVSFLLQLFVFVRERPDLVITTGAGFAIPMCFYGHVFGKKVIYIESFARMNSLNKSGVVIRKYADLFIVQWKELLELVPDAVYGGWIY